MVARMIATSFSDLASRAGRLFIGSLVILSAALSLAGEASLALAAPWRFRMPILAMLSLLDLFFTLEFALKAARSYSNRDLGGYFREGDGILDFCASVFPLLFCTGPFLFNTVSGLKDTSSILALGSFRVLRGLGLTRLFRLLRFLRAEREADGRPHRGAVRKAASLALVASLAAFVCSEAASLIGIWPDTHEALASRRGNTISALELARGADEVEAIALVDTDLLLVRSNGRVVYTRYSAEEYRRRFGPDEIGYLRGRQGVEAFFSLSGEIHAEAASSFVAGLSCLAILGAAALLFRRGEGGKA
jgi:hypothetical protein